MNKYISQKIMFSCEKYFAIVAIAHAIRCRTFPFFKQQQDRKKKHRQQQQIFLFYIKWKIFSSL